MTTDEQLVMRWQTKRDMKALDDLRLNTRPMLQSQVNKYRTNSVSNPLLMSEADRILVAAANSYRPGAGASFKTYLFTSLKKLNRFSAARSNIASIPEDRVQKITQFRQAHNDLSSAKNRQPTQAELTERLGWTGRQVYDMNRSLRRDLSETSVLSSPGLDTLDAKEKKLMHDIWYELTADEKRVMSMIINDGVKSGLDLSRKTGFSAAKISGIRTSIAKKMEKRM